MADPIEDVEADIEEHAPQCTLAELRIEEAREFVQAALSSLNDIVVGQCDGTESIAKPEYAKIKEAHGRLLAMRDAL